MPASFLREMVTKGGFMFANMLRDTLSTWATADFTPFKDTFRRFNDDLERLEKLVVGGYDFAIDRLTSASFMRMRPEEGAFLVTP